MEVPIFYRDSVYNWVMISIELKTTIDRVFIVKWDGNATTYYLMFGVVSFNGMAIHAFVYIRHVVSAGTKVIFYDQADAMAYTHTAICITSTTVDN